MATVAKPKGIVSRVELSTPVLPASRVGDFFYTHTDPDTGIKVWTSAKFNSHFADLMEPELPAAAIVQHKVEVVSSGQDIKAAVAASVGVGNETSQLARLQHLIITGQLDKSKWYLLFLKS